MEFRFCPLCGGPLYWVKIDNCKRLVCKKCGWIHYKNPLTVVVCIARSRENRIFLAKRNLAPAKN